MGDEFVGEDRSVGFDLDKVDGDGGHLGLYGSTEGVGERQIDVTKLKVDVDFIRLQEIISMITSGLEQRRRGHIRQRLES